MLKLVNGTVAGADGVLDGNISFCYEIYFRTKYHEDEIYNVYVILVHETSEIYRVNEY